METIDELLRKLIDEHSSATAAEAAYRAQIAQRTRTMAQLADRGVSAYRMARLLGLSDSAVSKFIGARARARAEA